MTTATADGPLTRATVEDRAAQAERAALAYLKSSVRWKWPANTRAVKGETLDIAREATEAPALGGNTPLFDWSIPSLRALTSFRNATRALWERKTVPWVEPAYRLIPKDLVPSFDQDMQADKEHFQDLLRDVQHDRPEIIESARKRRGAAFDARDYPTLLVTMFALEWDFADLTVPSCLRNMGSALHASQVARHQARMLGALQLAEQGYLTQLATLSSNLVEALKDPLPGQQKKLKTACLENIRNYIDDFRLTVLWGCEDCEEVFDEAFIAIDGVTREDLKASKDLREQVQASLTSVVQSIRAALLTNEE